MAALNPRLLEIEREYKGLCNEIYFHTSGFVTELGQLRQRIESDERLRRDMEAMGVRVRILPFKSLLCSTPLTSTEKPSQMAPARILLVVLDYIRR